MERKQENDFRVSVYAIALNEERLAERWYNCFKEADEVCVLDTGSTDKTVEILTRLGAKVTVKKYDKWTCLPELDALVALGRNPWRFDDARNEAMKLCSKDSTLLFCADLDDVIEPGWKERRRKIWERGKAEGEKTGHAPNCVLYNYSVVYPTADGDKRQTFVRHGIHTPCGWVWRNRCHEYLDTTGCAKNFIHAPDFNFESRPEKKDHSNYLPLLEADVRDGSADGRSIHLYARELMQNKRYDEAIEWFKQHLAFKGSKWVYERAASMKFISDCYAFKGDAERNELWLWKACAEDPADRDAPYALGRLLGSHKEYKLAQKVLTKCISIKEQHQEYPCFSLEAWTERPYLSLAECYFYDGLWGQALEYAEQALQINPKSKMARTTVKEIKDFMAQKKPLPPNEPPKFRIDLPPEG